MKNRTPEHLRCGGSQSSCPAVHELEDGRLVVVGKTVRWDGSHGDMDALRNRIAPDETAIIIDPAYLAEILK